MKTVLIRIILIFATLLIPAVAQNHSRAVIIFDASGSMWGQINGKPKITIAKDALKSVVNGWNPNIELGLTVYGHRKKGDCNDIERVVPIGKIDKKQIISIVEKISPKGKTPIAKSITQVANELKANEDESTIILISDGKESCNANPCEVAKQLKKDGINFVTHVIGFDVDKSTSKQLECIANATGGEYFSAENADALNKAMKTIVEKVEKPKPTPKPKVKKLDHTLEVTASESKDGKWIQASHEIHEDNDGKTGDYIKGINSYKKEVGKVQIPVGKYILVSKYNKFKKTTPFEIKAGEVTKLHVVMGQTGRVSVSASEKEGGKWIRASHTIYENDDGKAGDYASSKTSYKKEPAVMHIPVGKYILISKYNRFKKSTPFEVKAGETTKVHIVFAPFHVTIKGINKCSIITHEVVSTKGRTVTESTAPANKGADFVLPDGTYYIESTANGVTKKSKITIGGTDSTTGVTVYFDGEDSKSSPEGEWKTTEGKAKIRLDGTKLQGSYSEDNGEITGEMTYPQKFEGFWIEDKSNIKCSEPKNGRYYWGKMVWEFDDDMCSFKGKWGYCDKKPSNNWSGTYVKSLPKESTKEELIKADSQSETPVTPTNSEHKKSSKEEDVQKKIEDINKTISEHQDEIKKAGELLNALGGLFNQNQNK